MAAIEPSSDEDCISSPRRRTRRRPSASESTPAATMALYWPIEWPAKNAGVSRVAPDASASSRSASRRAIEEASSAGWALTVRSSVGPGPSQERRLIGCPSTASASAKTAAAAGECDDRSRPMPTVWDPWPGKTYATANAAWPP